MINFRFRTAVVPFVFAAAVFVSTSASSVPIVSFAQGVPNVAHPCATESTPGANDVQGLCTVPAAVSQVRTTWLSSLSGTSFEEFESPASRQLGSATLFSGEAALSASGASGLGFYTDPLVGPNFLGRFNTTNSGGAQGWWFEFGNGTATIQFSAAVEAFGFYLTDLGDETGSALVSLFNGQSSIAGGQNLAVAGRDANGMLLPLLSDNASVLFFGVVSDGNPFDRVTLQVNPSTQGRADFVGLDSLVFGNVDRSSQVPTPGSLTLVGLALWGLVGLQRIRR